MEKANKSVVSVLRWHAYCFIRIFYCIIWWAFFWVCDRSNLNLVIKKLFFILFFLLQFSCCCFMIFFQQLTLAAGGSCSLIKLKKVYSFPKLVRLIHANFKLYGKLKGHAFKFYTNFKLKGKCFGSCKKHQLFQKKWGKGGMASPAPTKIRPCDRSIELLHISS